MNLKDKLYWRLLESHLGTNGAEETLPAAENLIRDARHEKFWQTKPSRKLSEQALIRIWATYRRDLQELRERLRLKNEDSDNQLAWLVVFLIHHFAEMMQICALYDAEIRTELNFTWLNVTSEESLAVRRDVQKWVIEWLRDALRDDDLDSFYDDVVSESSPTLENS